MRPPDHLRAGSQLPYLGRPLGPAAPRVLDAVPDTEPDHPVQEKQPHTRKDEAGQHPQVQVVKHTRDAFPEPSFITGQQIVVDRRQSL